MTSAEKKRTYEARSTKQRGTLLYRTNKARMMQPPFCGHQAIRDTAAPAHHQQQQLIGKGNCVEGVDKSTTFLPSKRTTLSENSCRSIWGAPSVKA